MSGASIAGRLLGALAGVLVAGVLACGQSTRSSAPGPGEAAPIDRIGRVELIDRLGAQVPEDVVLTDQLGRERRVADLIDGERPVIVVLAYYRCPMLCGLTLQGVAAGLAELGWTPGEAFQVVTVSFDPRDRPADAERARSKVVEPLRAGLPGGVDEQAWPFMTGSEAEVRRLTDALGFHYAYDAQTDQYAHPSAVFVLSPEGALSRVLYGFDYPALDLRMALVEAGQGRVGSLAEQALIRCYRYDPSTRRYGFWVLGFFRIAGGLILLTVVAGLALLIGLDRRRTRKRAQREARA